MISCHPRDIGLLFQKVMGKEYCMIESGDRVEESWTCLWNKGKTKTPLVSIEDRTVVGTIDRGLNSTNHMPGVGGSRNW